MTKDKRIEEPDAVKKVLWGVERMLASTYSSSEAKKADILRYIERSMARYAQQQVQEAVKDAIKMSDQLESDCGRDGDKGTKQWMLFKGFRNTLRDKYLTQPQNEEVVDK